MSQLNCALCGEKKDAMRCPICKRVFCLELCFDVHFNARDSEDAPDRIDAFLQTRAASELLDAAAEVFRRNAYASEGFDWRHGLSCDRCRSKLREIVVHVLAMTAGAALQEIRIRKDD
ncbi:MAG: hypothetical protein Q6370_010785 [Candidatus Sigynarchaeota archaeon]